MKPEYVNVHDPFAIIITASLQKIWTGYDVVAYVPREIFRFCRYFLNYRGLLEGRVRGVRCKRSPIPKGGLTIPITMVVKKHKAFPAAFHKMKEFILDLSTTESPQCKKIESANWDEGAMCHWQFERIWPGFWCRGKPTNGCRVRTNIICNMYRLNLVIDQRYIFWEEN